MLANKVVFMYTELRCDIRAMIQKVAAYKKRNCVQVFLRSDVQFKKPGDMVTVLNIGKEDVFTREMSAYLSEDMSE